MVENKQGCENKVANALSRRSDFGFEDFAVSNTFVVSPCLCLISFPSPSCLCLISFPFQVLGFHLVHDSPLGGHSSFLKSFHRLKQDFFWVGMKSDLELHIRECGVCQQMKHETCKPAGLLQPLPIPYKPWTTVSMDFVNDLPFSQRLDTVMVIVDRLTKYVYFIGLSHPWWLPCLLKMSSNCMVCQHPLFLTRIQCSLLIFGLSYSNSKGLNLLCPQHIIHKLMARQKW